MKLGFFVQSALFGKNDKKFPILNAIQSFDSVFSVNGDEWLLVTKKKDWILQFFTLTPFGENPGEDEKKSILDANKVDYKGLRETEIEKLWIDIKTALVIGSKSRQESFDRIIWITKRHTRNQQRLITNVLKDYLKAFKSVIIIQKQGSRDDRNISDMSFKWMLENDLREIISEDFCKANGTNNNNEHSKPTLKRINTALPRSRTRRSLKQSGGAVMMKSTRPLLSPRLKMRKSPNGQRVPLLRSKSLNHKSIFASKQQDSGEKSSLLKNTERLQLGRREKTETHNNDNDKEGNPVRNNNINNSSNDNNNNNDKNHNNNDNNNISNNFNSNNNPPTTTPKTNNNNNNNSYTNNSNNDNNDESADKEDEDPWSNVDICNPNVDLFAMLDAEKKRCGLAKEEENLKFESIEDCITENVPYHQPTTKQSEPKFVQQKQQQQQQQQQQQNEEEIVINAKDNYQVETNNKNRINEEKRIIRERKAKSNDEIRILSQKTTNEKKSSINEDKEKKRNVKIDENQHSKLFIPKNVPFTPKKSPLRAHLVNTNSSSPQDTSTVTASTTTTVIVDNDEESNNESSSLVINGLSLQMSIWYHLTKLFNDISLMHLAHEEYLYLILGKACLIKADRRNDSDEVLKERGLCYDRLESALLCLVAQTKDIYSKLIVSTCSTVFKYFEKVKSSFDVELKMEKFLGKSPFLSKFNTDGEEKVINFLNDFRNEDSSFTIRDCVIVIFNSIVKDSMLLGCDVHVSNELRLIYGDVMRIFRELLFRHNADLSIQNGREFMNRIEECKTEEEEIKERLDDLENIIKSSSSEIPTETFESFSQDSKSDNTGRSGSSIEETPINTDNASLGDLLALLLKDAVPKELSLNISEETGSDGGSEKSEVSVGLGKEPSPIWKESKNRRLVRQELFRRLFEVLTRPKNESNILKFFEGIADIDEICDCLIELCYANFSSKVSPNEVKKILDSSPSFVMQLSLENALVKIRDLSIRMLVESTTFNPRIMFDLSKLSILNELDISKNSLENWIQEQPTTLDRVSQASVFQIALSGLICSIFRINDSDVPSKIPQLPNSDKSKIQVDETAAMTKNDGTLNGNNPDESIQSKNKNEKGKISSNTKKRRKRGRRRLINAVFNPKKEDKSEMIAKEPIDEAKVSKELKPTDMVTLNGRSRFLSLLWLSCVKCTDFAPYEEEFVRAIISYRSLNLREEYMGLDIASMELLLLRANVPQLFEITNGNEAKEWLPRICAGNEEVLGNEVLLAAGIQPSNAFSKPLERHYEDSDTEDELDFENFTFEFEISPEELEEQGRQKRLKKEQEERMEQERLQLELEAQEKQKEEEETLMKTKMENNIENEKSVQTPSQKKSSGGGMNLKKFVKPAATPLMQYLDVNKHVSETPIQQRETYKSKHSMKDARPRRSKGIRNSSPLSELLSPTPAQKTRVTNKAQTPLFQKIESSSPLSTFSNDSFMKYIPNSNNGKNNNNNKLTFPQRFSSGVTRKILRTGKSDRDIFRTVVKSPSPSEFISAGPPIPRIILSENENVKGAEPEKENRKNNAFISAMSSPSGTRKGRKKAKMNLGKFQKTDNCFQPFDKPPRVPHSKVHSSSRFENGKMETSVTSATSPARHHPLFENGKMETSIISATPPARDHPRLSTTVVPETPQSTRKRRNATPVSRKSTPISAGITPPKKSHKNTVRQLMPFELVGNNESMLDLDEGKPSSSQLVMLMKWMKNESQKPNNKFKSVSKTEARKHFDDSELIDEAYDQLRKMDILGRKGKIGFFIEDMERFDEYYKSFDPFPSVNDISLMSAYSQTQMTHLNLKRNVVLRRRSRSRSPILEPEPELEP